MTELDTRANNDHSQCRLDPHRDLVIAIMGGSVSLAGLLLVFAGFMFSQAAYWVEYFADYILDRLYPSEITQ